MKTLALLHMPFTMGMGRAAREYIKIFESMGYEVKCLNWFDIVAGRERPVENTDVLFSFIVPRDHLLSSLQQIVAVNGRAYGMTVWETDQPPECFLKYVNIFEHMFAPSMFTANMFNPALTYLPHYVAAKSYSDGKIDPALRKLLETPGYKYYSISDFTDPRKNMQQMVEGFLACEFPDAKLVLKHNRDSADIIQHPHIVNIVGELTDSEMAFIHESCHCYVNLSFSEGVGLGVVEAAIRDKPVIMTDYGGQNEFVETQWLVKTRKGQVGYNRLLFTTDMTWGIPDYADYVRTLKDVYRDSPKNDNHDRTRDLVSSEVVESILRKHGL